VPIGVMGKQEPSCITWGVARWWDRPCGLLLFTAAAAASNKRINTKQASKSKREARAGITSKAKSNRAVYYNLPPPSPSPLQPPVPHRKLCR
jgi:hypothetical protein